MDREVEGLAASAARSEGLPPRDGASIPSLVLTIEAQIEALRPGDSLTLIETEIEGLEVEAERDPSSTPATAQGEAETIDTDLASLAG